MPSGPIGEIPGGNVALVRSEWNCSPSHREIDKPA
jgi:hypothetical protein